MRLKNRLVFWALGLLVLALSGCGERLPYKQQSYVFGTLVEVTIQGEPEDKAKRVAEHVLRTFDEMHRTLHAWEPSTLERFNAQLAKATPAKPARGEVPAELLPILQDAARYAVQSDHLFNPAIGGLIGLWGFQTDVYEPDVPSQEEIDKLVQARPRLTDIHIEGNRFENANPAVRIDLGGYAKGYALDLAAAYLRREGVKNALVNIGGNIIALGRHGDRPWRVGIQHPRRAGAIATLELHDGEAIGTSGDYQRYFLVDETRYCHLIDPRTGSPVRGVRAVTVLTRGAGAGVLSDVASKPLFISGAQDWREMAKRMGIDQALFIAGDGSMQVTAPLASRLQWEDNGATPKVVP